MRRALDVLLTGAYGRVGTAIIDHLASHEGHESTYLDREDHPEHETVVADVADYDAIRPTFEDETAVIHLAGVLGYDPQDDGEGWDALSG